MQVKQIGEQLLHVILIPTKPFGQVLRQVELLKSKNVPVWQVVHVLGIKLQVKQFVEQDTHVPFKDTVVFGH